MLLVKMVGNTVICIKSIAKQAPTFVSIKTKENGKENIRP